MTNHMIIDPLFKGQAVTYRSHLQGPVHGAKSQIAQISFTKLRNPLFLFLPPHPPDVCLAGKPVRSLSLPGQRRLLDLRVCSWMSINDWPRLASYVVACCHHACRRAAWQSPCGVTEYECLEIKVTCFISGDAPKCQLGKFSHVDRKRNLVYRRVSCSAAGETQFEPTMQIYGDSHRTTTFHNVSCLLIAQHVFTA